MKATYRPVLASDESEFLAMMQNFYAIDGYPIDLDRSRELLSEFITNPNLGRAWMIEYDGSAVGYVILSFMFSFEFKGRLAFLDELYLSDGARGKGIGRQTIEFVKQEARKLDVKVLYLEVEHHNALAQKLYLSAGFEIHNRRFMQHKLD
jgi:ribosomal protein S18 acetylase RimI-like enzyme